ncbi:MAG: hemerythrin domain-containing protein [Paludibacteraceae bacterium]|nr:hemerythrin domain-containing protein [Paludibacteraceae bacterium]
MYTLDSRMIDMITADPNVVLLLPRFGIGLGFGNDTVAKVCSRAQVPEQLFLMVCNVYSFDNYSVTRDELRSLRIDSLFGYLKASHQYYLNDRLKHICGHLNSVAESAGKQGQYLTKFYSEYVEQVERHFQNEEKRLFPAIAGLVRGEQVEITVIDEFIKHHDRLDEQLSDLIQLVLKYIPGVNTEDSTEMLFDIITLVRDLQKHAQIEEQVLMPYIKQKLV